MVKPMSSTRIIATAPAAVAASICAEPDVCPVRRVPKHTTTAPRTPVMSAGAQ
jgi:hypothetical protein